MELLGIRPLVSNNQNPGTQTGNSTFGNDTGYASESQLSDYSHNSSRATGTFSSSTSSTSFQRPMQPRPTSSSNAGHNSRNNSSTSDYGSASFSSSGSGQRNFPLNSDSRFNGNRSDHSSGPSAHQTDNSNR